MEVGIFDHVEKRDGDLRALYESRFALLALAERVGFYCYHVAEHQGTPLSMAPSPSVLLAAAAERTERILLGPLCYILPLYDPLRLANEICMLDHLSGGRLQVGIGRGVSPIELGFFNVDPATTRATFDEELEILRRALTSPVLDYEGAHYTYRSVPMELAPRQTPHPPFWYPTSNPETVPWVAQQGFHTVFLGAPDHVAEEVRRYEDSVDSPEQLATTKRGMLRYVFVAETDAEAEKVAGPAYAAHLANLRHLARLRGSRDRAAVPDTSGARESNPTEIAAAVAKGWAAVGSPATVTEQIEAMVDATGCNYLVFNPLLADTPLDVALASVEAFGDSVLPRLAAL